MKARFEFEPRDMWVGVYWDARRITGVYDWTHWDVYICIIPMVPLHIWWVSEN